MMASSSDVSLAMTQRALVLASQIRGLVAVNGDAAHMTAALRKQGFEVDHRFDQAADRAGMIDGWRKLIDASEDGDAAVVYYAGHGAQFLNTDPDAGSPGVPRKGQVILPFDYDLNTEEDFRGITSWEMSLLLAELTKKTRNVTIILDCCYAAVMARDAAEAIPRGLSHPVRLGIKKHLEDLESRGARFEVLDPLGNPDAVRAFAAGPHQTSWEYPVNGVYRGAFTEAVTEILDQLDPAKVTWASVAGAIRDQVTRRFMSQTPQFAGPTGRLLFSTHEPRRTVAVSVTRKEGRTVVEAGRITGARVGDTFRVMPAGSTASDRNGALATATVTEVAATESTIDLDPALPDLPAGALAFPLTQGLAREPVVIVGYGARASELRTRAARAPRLRLVSAGAAEPPVATVEVKDDVAVVADEVGRLLEPIALGADGKRLDELVAFLSDLAVARTLRAMQGVYDFAPDCCVASWGVVENGAQAERPSSGAVLGLQDRIYVRLENRNKQAEAWVHVFNVGSRGKITRLSRATPLGIKLVPGEPVTVGDVPGKGMVGLSLSWPKDLPRDQPRVDELYVIATSTPVDLGVLETEQAIARGMEAKGGKALARLVAQVQLGGARSVDSDIPDGFMVQRFDFLLDPVALRLASPSFSVDNSPTGAAAGGVLARGAWREEGAIPRGTPRSRRIAVRLDEVVVHANHALWKTAVRVDALVCTRHAPGAKPYVVETMRFPRIGDDHRLPLDRALLFEGDATDFLDLCLWISRDRAGADNLFALLEKRISDPSIREALATLTAGATPWASAVGASLGLVRMSHDLLGAAVGTSIGLYRTSFLAGEHFGLGRHPATGLLRAQDFSFALRIDPG